MCISNSYKIELDKIILFKRLINGENSDESDHIGEDFRKELNKLNNINFETDEKLIHYFKTLKQLSKKYDGDLISVFKPEDINLIFNFLLSDFSFKAKSMILKVLFELTLDVTIKKFLYERKIIEIFLSLYSQNSEYFFLICKILGNYLENTPDDIKSSIVHLILPTNKKLLKVVFQHSEKTLYFISKLILNWRFQGTDKINKIADLLTDCLNYAEKNKTISEIVYCFYCLISKYPNEIIIFSKPQIVLTICNFICLTKLPFDILTNILILIQYILSVDGTHVIYFAQIPQLFSTILDKMNGAPLQYIQAAFKVMHLAACIIPGIADYLVEKLDFQCLLDSQFEFLPFGLKKFGSRIIFDLIKYGNFNNCIKILQCKVLYQILPIIDDLSREYCIYFLDSFFESVRRNGTEILLQSNTQIYKVIENFANSDDNIIQAYAQDILSIWDNMN